MSIRQSKSYNLLTISDRYEEGGAADIARKVHLYANKTSEFNSTFAYGWSKKGLPNKSFPELVKCTSLPFGPHINAILFPFMGKNIIPSYQNRIETLIRRADLIHIHNIHTYGFKYEQIVGLINKYEKPVVITAHDDWYYTGRCAIKKDCSLWKEGCPKCPHLDYYHRAIIDNAKREYRKKTEIFETLEKVIFTAPSIFVSDNLRLTYPSKNIVTVKNGIDTSPFSVSAKEGYQEEQPLNCLVIDNNFKNSVKLDYTFLDYVIESGVKLKLVGKESPYVGKNVENFGYLSSRKELNSAMQQADILLFFSKVDSFGLVLAEALCAGLYICAYESQAVNEVAKDFEKSIISENPEAFIKLMKSKAFIRKVRNPKNKKERSLRAKNIFDEKIMMKNYLEIYRGLLENEK